MNSTLYLYAVLYAAGLVFLIACAVRAVGYARLPLHLRWELYPVPHEEKERARHGGSYFETSNWWTHRPETNRAGELKYMLEEIVFLKGLWEFNRKMWRRSYPFHLGLYFLISSGVVVIADALLSIGAPGGGAGAAGAALRYGYVGLGWAGAALTLIGAVALLFARMTDDDLKRYTVPGDIFNLLFFIVAVGFLVAGYFFRPADSVSASELARGAIAFDAGLKVPALLQVGLILAALLLAYIPMTHMAHFIAKYFTYHSVRWDDAPNRRDTRLERRLAEYLTYRPNWAAPHVGADGVKTWAEIATTIPPQGGKK